MRMVIEEGRLQVERKQSMVWFDQHVETGNDAGKVHLDVVRIEKGKLEHLQVEVDDPRPSGFPYQRPTKANIAIFKKVR